jgi:dipeptidyl aminopeptidase/acylaminoacyl peptidase
MHHDPFVLDGEDIALFQNVEDLALGVAHLPDGKFTLLDVRIRLIVGYARGVLLYIDPTGALMAAGFDPRAGTLTSQPVPVSNTPRGLRSAAMSTDGTLVMQVEPDAFRLEVVDEHGVGTPLLPDTLIDVNARYSPDGTRVALALTSAAAEGVYVFDLRTRTLSRLAPSTRPVSRVEWTPDGKRVVVSGFGSPQVDWLAADASDQPSVLYSLPDSVRAYWASFTPDGHELILGTNLGTGAANISVVRLDGDSALKALVASDANEVAPRLSPNGQWLAYASDESGRNQIYARPYPGPGPRVQMSDEGGTQPMWSRDGRRLFYRSGDALMSLDVRVDPTSAQLLGSNRRELFQGKFLGNDLIRVLSLYDVAPDGKQFLFARALAGSRFEIVVWVNWLDEVKAQLSRQR